MHLLKILFRTKKSNVFAVRIIYKSKFIFLYYVLLKDIDLSKTKKSYNCTWISARKIVLKLQYCKQKSYNIIDSHDIIWNRTIPTPWFVKRAYTLISKPLIMIMFFKYLLKIFHLQRCLLTGTLWLLSNVTIS